MSIRRLLAVIVSLVSLVVFWGYLFFVLFLGAIYVLDYSLIKEAGYFTVSFLTTVYFIVLVFFIVFFLFIFFVLWHRGSLGMWILGLEYSPSDVKRIVARYTVGIWLDIMFLPITFLFVLLNKPTFGERFADTSTVGSPWNKALILRAFLWSLFFILSAVIFGLLRLPYTVGALLDQTEVREYIFDTFVSNNTRLLEIFYKNIGLVSSKELCIYSLYRSNAKGISTYCTDLLLQSDSYLNEKTYLSLIEWSLSHNDYALLKTVFDRIVQDTKIMGFDKRFQIYLLLENLDEDSLDFKEKRVVKDLKNTIYSQLYGHVLSVTSLEQWIKEFIRHLADKKQYDEVLSLLHHFEEVIEDKDSLAWVYFTLGEVYFYRKQYRDARKYFKKAINLDEAYSDKVKLYIR